MEKAKIAYDAYKRRSGGRSAFSGDPLPEFEKLNGLIQRCWAMAARAVEEEVTGRKINFFDVEGTDIPCEFYTDKGVIEVSEGWAAGAPWLLVEFMEGELRGKKVWMQVLREKTAVYLTNTADDGFLFNRDPGEDRPQGIDEVEGGGYFLELNGMEINLV